MPAGRFAIVSVFVPFVLTLQRHYGDVSYDFWMMRMQFRHCLVIDRIVVRIRPKNITKLFMPILAIRCHRHQLGCAYPTNTVISNGTLNISFHSSAIQPNKQHEYNFSSIASLWVYSIKCEGRSSFYFWIFHFFSLFVVPNFSSQHFHIFFFQNSCMTFGLPRCTALHYRALQLTLINLRRSIQFTGVIAYYADCLLCIDMNR